MKAQLCNRRAARRASLNALMEPALFQALCDSTRLCILGRLAACCTPQTVSQVAKRCPVDVSVVSRHLAVLRGAGILSAERRGRFVLYSVRYRDLSRALRSLADAIDACCPAGVGLRRRKARGRGSA